MVVAATIVSMDQKLELELLEVDDELLFEYEESLLVLECNDDG